MADAIYLVLIETSGNQNFIFGISNKVREAIGASEMIYRVGTQMFLEAVRKNGGPSLVNDWKAGKLNEALLQPTKNPPIESGAMPVEIWLASSGKAMAFVQSRDIGKSIVKHVTQTALREAPGVMVHGAVSEVPVEINDQSTASSLHREAVQLHRLHKSLRSRLPAPESRFPRLPPLAICALTGLPAENYDPDAREHGDKARSLVSRMRREAGQEARGRLERLSGWPLPKNIDELVRRMERLEWLAVIHADGNGVGEIFQCFDQCSNASTARDYVNVMRRFSVELDACSQQAYREALDWYVATTDWEEKRRKNPNLIIPVIPLIVGGDDLTLVCDGSVAVQLAEKYLSAFERYTASPPPIDSLDGSARSEHVLPQIANRKFSYEALGASAGIVIAKPHFPFHVSYQIAESLCSSAKRVKVEVYRSQNGKPQVVPCTALDFYVHNMSSNADLEVIRSQLVVDDTILFGGPYVVTEQSKLVEISTESSDWIQPRSWQKLCKRVDVLRARDPEDENKRKIPNSLVHRIRGKLRDGHAVTNNYIDLIEHRYPGVRELRNGGTLFWEEKRSELGQGTGYCTNLLDAMSLTGLWLG